MYMKPRTKLSRFNTIEPDYSPNRPLTPILYAWVNSSDMGCIWTTLNHFPWPVPLPCGVKLEDIGADLMSLNVSSIFCA